MNCTDREVIDYLIMGRFFMDSYQRKHRFYAVTDMRVMIIELAWGRTIRSKSLDDLGEISLKVRSDGSGDVTFGQQSPWFIAEGIPQPGFPKPMVFEMIEDVREVFGIIRNAQKESQLLRNDAR